MIQRIKAVLEDVNAEYDEKETHVRFKELSEDQNEFEVIINHMDKMWVATVDMDDFEQNGKRELFSIIEDIGISMTQELLTGEKMDMIDVREL